MLKEHAEHFYREDRCNCAEAVLLAANAEYDLGLTDDQCKLVGGFGGGVGCGITCGALLGAVAALGAKGETNIFNTHYIDRGYDRLCDDLKILFRLYYRGQYFK